MNPKIPKIILVAAVLLLLLLSINEFLYSRLKNTTFSVLSPLQKFLWRAQKDLSRFPEALFNLKTLKIENQELQKENFFLKNQIAELQSLKEENKDLREALALGLENDFQLILAEVVSKKSQEDAILINKGREDGIEKGLPVISKEKVLVGRIGKVFDNFSQVILISSDGFTFSVEIEAGEERILGAGKGKGVWKLRVEFLPKEIDIEKGNLVVTSVLGGIFPENLLVGQVTGLRKTAPEPFQEAEVRPYFRELDLKRLFILKEF